MGELRRKIGRFINLSWSIPLLAVVFVVGMLISWTVEKRQLRLETTPRDEDENKT